MFVPSPRLNRWFFLNRVLTPPVEEEAAANVGGWGRWPVRQEEEHERDIEAVIAEQVRRERVRLGILPPEPTPEPEPEPSGPEKPGVAAAEAAVPVQLPAEAVELVGRRIGAKDEEELLAVLITMMR